MLVAPPGDGPRAGLRRCAHDRAQAHAPVRAAADELGTERVQYVHPDCGFWMLPRSVAAAKMRALVAGRDLFAGGAGS